MKTQSGVIIRYRTIGTKMVAGFALVALFISAPGQVAAAVNLIINGDFETVDASNPSLPAGWSTGYTPAGATSVYQYPVSGVTGNGAQVTMQSGTTGADAKWYFAPVPVTAGRDYNFTDNYSSTVTTEIVLEFFDASNQHLSYGGWFAVAATAPSVWATTNITFTAPANAAYVTVFHTVTNGTLTVDNYSLTEVPLAVAAPFNKGIVTFAFDDGWTSQFTSGVPALNTRNLKGSFYIITDAMNHPQDGYATSSTLLAAQAQGHELGSHTVTHCNLATGLCPDGPVPNAPDALTAQQEFANSRAALLAIGATPVQTLVYPYGAYLPAQTSLLASSSYIGARTVQDGFNNKASDVYTLKTKIIDRGVTAANISQVQGWIDTAIQNHEWLILTFHQIENASVISAKNIDGATTPQFFSQIVTYVADKRDANQVMVKTMGDVLTHCMDADESDCVNPVNKPIITIDPYVTTPTNKNIVVNAHTNKGTLNATTTTFTTNGIFNFVATDSLGNTSTTTVVINNIDKVAPVITPAANLVKEATAATGLKLTYTLPVSTDPITCTPNSGTTFAMGTTSVSCISTDAAGNTSTSSFSVFVRDTTAPAITLVGATTQNIALGAAYTELGATAKDAVSGTLTSAITVNSSSVNTNVAGTYTVTYTVKDAAGNTGIKTRTVKVLPRTISIAANTGTKLFGTTDPLLTYRITTGSLLAGDSLTGGLKRAVGENVGSYTINIGTLTAGSNYTLTYTSAKFTITCPAGKVWRNNRCV
jgi:peptidoglycan/xylan/chitin deacetylase (PgdA/CDA1 family)